MEKKVQVCCLITPDNILIKVVVRRSITFGGSNLTQSYATEIQDNVVEEHRKYSELFWTRKILGK